MNIYFHHRFKKLIQNEMSKNHTKCRCLQKEISFLANGFGYTMTATLAKYTSSVKVFLQYESPFPKENMQRDSGVHDQVIFWAVIDGFLFFAIVSGNVLTIAAILMNRRISHVVSNQFILSLACSDLFVGLVLPYHMMFYIEPSLGEHFGLCITRLVLVSLACTASVMNIIGIAIDRFLAIVYPLHYNTFMTKR